MIDGILLVFGVNYYIYRVFNEESGFSLVNFGVVQMIVIAMAVIYLLICLNVKVRQYDSVYIIKNVILFSIIALTIVLSTGNQMALRHDSLPHKYVHDHPIQLESALQFFSNKKNPYAETYHDTPLPLWRNWSDNPAIHHFVTPPGNILLSILPYEISNQLFNWYDHRVVNIIFLLIAIASLYLLIQNRQLKLTAVIVFVFNPLFIHFFIEGQGDIMFLGLILLSLALLRYKRINFSLVALALAMTAKQTAWFIAPFYFFYLWQKSYLKKDLITKISLFTAVFVFIVMPFVIWDARSFINDTFHYPAGTLPTSYPISGYGLSMVLVNLELIESRNDYFPFFWLQLPVLVPLLIYLLYIQKKNPSISQVVLNYGIFLWVFWLLSRFFNANYIGVVLILIATGAIVYLDENIKNGQSKAKLTKTIGLTD